jgi:HAD superfamily hydrolase (TIGR01509 family)
MTSTPPSPGLRPEVVEPLEALLCDADGNLFPSEEPAFAASADDTNAFLTDLGVARRYAPEELRLATTGMTSRRTAAALAAVSSSALARLHGCFAATGLAELVPPNRIFSAEDSLPIPTSKPDPAVYLHACERLGIPTTAGLAVEDAVPGARSAIAAGCPTVGNIAFVPAPERAERVAALREVGVLAVVDSWAELADMLLPHLPPRAGADRLVPAGGAR